MDWRTSRVRARSAMSGDWMLRLVYLEALNALHEAGGELPADPEALADELMLPADEIARCLPILQGIGDRGGRGGLIVENGRLTNARVTEDLAAELRFREAQAAAGQASATVRRTRTGSACPRTTPERPLNGGSTTVQPPPNDRSTTPERPPNPPLPAPTPLPTPENGPPLHFPPASRVGTGGDGTRSGVQPGDVLRGLEVLEVDEAGRPLVVRKRLEGSAPRLTREADAAVGRLVEYASRELGHRFDRLARRRLRDRLLGGETEGQIRASYEAQVRTLQDLDADPDLAQALQLLAPPGGAA